MVVIYCCLEKENYKIFKFLMNNFCYFEIRDSLFKLPPNKHWTSMLQNYISDDSSHPSPPFFLKEEEGGGGGGV